MWLLIRRKKREKHQKVAANSGMTKIMELAGKNIETAIPMFSTKGTCRQNQRKRKIFFKKGPIKHLEIKKT